MKDGVSTGVQIRRLREQTGFSATELAEAAGLGVDVVREIESGNRDFETEEVFAIAEFLGISPLAIFEPDSLLGRLPVAPSPNGDGSSCAKVRRLLTSLAEFHHVLSLNGHHASIPSIIDKVPRRKSSSTWLNHANDLADWTVDQLGIVNNGNIRLSDLAAAIERCLGIDVMVEAKGADAPLGASITDTEFPFIMVNADQPTPQALFVLAHELGHVLSQDGCLLHIDINLRGLTDSKRFANAFAAAFLMPESQIRETIGTYEQGPISLAHMLIEFGVSYESLIFRLHNLKVINAYGRDRLQSAGWSGLVHALGDTDLSRTLLSTRGTKPERRPPSLLAKRCWRGMLDGHLSARPLAGLLDIDVDDLIDSIESVGSETMSVINGDYSSPLDSDETTRSVFDTDPVAA